MSAEEVRPTTQAGRALLALLHADNIEEMLVDDWLENEAAKHILAIEAEAVKPWREALEQAIDAYRQQFDLLHGATPLADRIVQREDRVRPWIALLATPPESGVDSNS